MDLPDKSDESSVEFKKNSCKDEKVVGIHQPEHLPWIGFFNKMHKSDVFVLLDNVQFRKNYFQNRNMIKTPQGGLWLSVPILRKGSGQLIKDVNIDNSKSWAMKYWKTVQQNYRKAPHFEDYESDFGKIFERMWQKIGELNIALIKLMMHFIGMKKELVIASEIGAEGKSTDLLVDICEKLNATSYLSGKFGKGYLDEKKFEEKNIRVEYQHFVHPTYPQLWGSFLPNMSAADLLFNCGEKSFEYIQKS
jgi:hypothetical protein